MKQSGTNFNFITLTLLPGVLAEPPDASKPGMGQQLSVRKHGGDQQEYFK